MTNAIWQGDAATVRELVVKDPQLLHEDARGVEGNWGPPMSYAANVGRTEIIEMLHNSEPRMYSAHSPVHVFKARSRPHSAYMTWEEDPE
jgi:hypothetical protein